MNEHYDMTDDEIETVPGWGWVIQVSAAFWAMVGLAAYKLW